MSLACFTMLRFFIVLMGSKMRRIIVTSLVFYLIGTGLFQLKAQEYPDQPPLRQGSRAYYAIAYHYHTRKIPTFKRRINPRYLHYFKRYYVVYHQNNYIYRFEVYENNILFSRNVITRDYVRSERFSPRGHRILSQKLYYNNNSRLKREENYRNGHLFTYYLYYYGDHGRREKMEIYNPQGDRIGRFYYGRYRRDKPLVHKSESYSGGEAAQSMKARMPRVRIKSLKVIRDNFYKTFRVIVKLYNEDEINLQGLTISVDLYNELGGMVDSIAGKPKGHDTTLEPGSTLVLESGDTRMTFTRIRIYIHYNDDVESELHYIGPYYFSPHRKRKNSYR